MASKNIIQIIIDAKNNASAAFRDARQDATGMQNAFGALKAAAAGIGLAFAAREVVEFGAEARRAALSLEGARNKLTLAAGGAEQYEATIKAAKEATRGMVSETDLANGAFVLMEMNLAKSTEEAAQLANAGNILSKAFESQGASVELFNRLLANGSAVLLDNFGISQAQVRVRTDQIIASEGLAEAEARLQAIRELAIDKSERLAGTMTNEAIAAERATASYQDMMAALGDLVLAQERQVDALGTTATFYEFVTRSAEGWGQAMEFAAFRNDLTAKAVERLGRALTLEETMMIENGNVTGELAAVLDQLTLETDKASDAQRRGVGTLDSYRQMADLTAKQMEAGLAQALDAQTARWQGLANAQRTASGGEALLETMAGGSTFNATEAADFETAQKEKEQAAKQTATAITSTFDQAATDMANSISSAVGGAFNRIKEIMPDLGGGEDQAGEFGRRLAALQPGEYRNAQTLGRRGGVFRPQ